MSDYIEREFPILDEHDVVDDLGNVVLSLTEERLEQIAENNNQRIEETGDETPIVIGHTKDKTDEPDQPEIVGWAHRFKVRQLFDTGRKAIFCVGKFMKEKLDTIKRHPRRSVELWLKKMLIDPISLLGATTPERSLGLLKFSSGEQKYSSILPDEEDTDMDKNEMVSAVLEALKQTDVWKYMESQMNAASQEPAQMDAGEPSQLHDGDGGDEPNAYDEPADESGNPVAEGDQDSQDKKKYAAAPSGSNTYTPGDDVKKLQSQHGQLKEAHKKTCVELHNLKLKFQASERSKDLMQLRDKDGVDLDLKEEVDYVTNLDDAQYQKHLDRIKKRYSKSITGVQVMHTANTEGGTARSKDQAMEIANYAAEHGLTYAEARKKYQGK